MNTGRRRCESAAKESRSASKELEKGGGYPTRTLKTLRPETEAAMAYAAQPRRQPPTPDLGSRGVTSQPWQTERRAAENARGGAHAAVLKARRWLLFQKSATTPSPTLADICDFDGVTFVGGNSGSICAAQVVARSQPDASAICARRASLYTSAPPVRPMSSPAGPKKRADAGG